MITKENISDMETVEFLGAPLPIIARRSDGLMLVAHPNGPGLLSGHWLMTLGCTARDDSNCDREDIQWAIDQYVEWSWPQVEAHQELLNSPTP